MTRIGSLFSGYGGLDIGVQAVIGGEIAWHVENNPAAAKLLAHHWPDVPNLTDVTAIDWYNTDAVDVLTGGFPCQDVSSAGRQAGLRPDSRSGLWAHMARAVHILRPQLVIVENVKGLRHAAADSALEPCPWCLGDERDRPLRALGAVLGDLAVLGYDAQWCSFRASDVGAPHARERVFIVATDAEPQRCLRRRESPRTPNRSSTEADRLGEGDAAAHPDGVDARPVGARDRGGQPESAPRDGDRVASDSALNGRHEGQPEPEAEQGRSDALRRDLAASDADSDRREGRQECDGEPSDERAPLGVDPDGRLLEWGDYWPAIEQWAAVVGRAAPEPTQLGKRGGAVLAPRFVEWLMGIDEGHVTAVPGLSRQAQLRLLGNGVVPQQAAAAVHHLLTLEGSYP